MSLPPSAWAVPHPGTPGGPSFVLRTLGALELDGRAGTCRAVLAQPKRLALLVYLASAREGSFVRRDTLLPLFWPERAEGPARTALRQALRFLRTALGADVIEARGVDELRLRPGALWSDAHAFRRAIAAASPADALELYRGDFLAGFFVANAHPDLEQWMALERTGLRRAAIDAVMALANAHEERDELDAAVRVIRRGVAIDPLHEELHRQLMILLDASGDRVGALETYTQLAQRLAREVDAAPSPDTRALRDRIHKRGARPDKLAEAEAPPSVTSASALPPRDAVAATPAELLVHDAALVMLPFAGRDVHEGVLGAGMAEMLHAVLRSVPGFSLAPMASESLAAIVRHDDGARRRIVGRALLLDGRVTRADDGVVVELRLLQGTDGAVRWQERFTRPAREIFALQERIAAALGAALEIRLPTADEPRLRRPTHDLEAYNLYLRGRWHWTRRPRETQKALEYLERAIARDPTFALAHAAIADCYNTLGSWEASLLPAWEAFPRAHAAARKALALEPTLAEGRTALGYAEMHYTWRMDAAERELREAVRLAPTYGHAHHWHSHLLLARGRIAESLEASRAALACDPVDPVLNVHLAWHHWLAREPEEGIAQCARTLELHPGDHWSPFFTGVCEVALGRPDAAVQSLRDALTRSGDSVVMAAALAHALVQSGDVGEARALLTALERSAEERRLLAYEIALVHAALGATDVAFTWLDRACEERSAWLAYAAVEPRLDVLRGDERFASLLRAIRLAPVGAERSA